MRAQLYEVWYSTGTGTHVGPKFRLLEDAIGYVKSHGDQASYAVRAPTGEWAMIAQRETSRDPVFDGRSAKGTDQFTANLERARTRPWIASGTGAPADRKPPK